ncbi:hypothetical protein [Pseudomaricurvus sp. HS19]|uniref:hypothetical protein n=1 Tax=Pseudomaricurvus sp. HS19 TaxID=2692626 RepID=UPI001369BE75|nr:hypothetical protein [Pseudomaricurvus sp. HS19]MYM63340.1 hypothetical protein [Pseudomaricurvus sp. HS19]
MHNLPVIAICGVPGSGKSSLTAALVLETGGLHLDMDEYQTFTDQDVHAIAAQADHTGFYNLFDVPELDTHLAGLKSGQAVALPGAREALRAMGPIVFETHFGRAHHKAGQYIDVMIWLDCPLALALTRKLSFFLDEFLRDDHQYLPLLEHCGFEPLSITCLPLESDFRLILARKR